MTPLDALCAMPFHQADEAARSAVLHLLADTALFAAMEKEAMLDQARLMRLDTGNGQIAVACDTDDRLATFFGRPVDYASMPGRVLAGLLAREGVGLLVNPGSPSEMLLEPQLLAWLVDALAGEPDTAKGRATLSAPDPQVVQDFMPALGKRLADMAGIATAATLARAIWQDGREGHLVLVEGADPHFEPAIAKALAELAAFLPPLPGGLDVSFAALPIPQGAPRIVIEAAPQAETPSVPKKTGPPILR